MYFGGQTQSPDFPMQNNGGFFRSVLDGDGTGTDAFILKFDANGSRVWATYWGGSSGDRVRAMQCHPVNNKLYVIGETYSTNLPIQSLTGAYNDGTHNGSQDIFIARFTTATELEWSTYFGGSGSEHAHHIDFDGNGNMYMVGEHSGWSVPASSPPLVNPGGGAHFDNTVNGKQDLYLNKFNSSGQHVWGTYYGGNFNDNYNGDCSGMSIKSNNNIVICGKTASGNFPTTSRSGAYNDATHNGTPDSDNDGYIVEFNPAGVIQWATYYGGSGSEELRNLDHDDSDNLLVGGFTTSSNIPLLTHTGSYNQSYAGSTDGLILWFDANGARVWATCVGTSAAEDIRPFGVTTVAYNPFSILTSTANGSVGLRMPVVDPGGGAHNDNGGVGMWFARFDQGISLAVDLVSFDAHLNLNKEVLCRWRVASELNNKGFSVERSADGVEWTSIGFVDGRGTTLDAANYRFLDENPLTAYSYYRLKQMDFDGQFTNSNVVSVQLLEDFEEEVLIYPNPADEQLFIEVADGLHLQQVRIFDVLRRELRTFNNVQNAIPTADLNAGVYLISLEFPHKTINKKIRIE